MFKIGDRIVCIDDSDVYSVLYKHQQYIYIGEGIILSDRANRFAYRKTINIKTMSGVTLHNIIRYRLITLKEYRRQKINKIYDISNR